MLAPELLHGIWNAFVSNATRAASMLPSANPSSSMTRAREKPWLVNCRMSFSGNACDDADGEDVEAAGPDAEDPATTTSTVWWMMDQILVSATITVWSQFPAEW